MNKYIKASVFVGLLLLLTFYLFSLEKNYQEINIEFYFQSDTLRGVLVLPEEHDRKYEQTPLVTFVHGDGALDRTAYGYYIPIWNELTRNGVAVISWDKKGVGGSTGDWLNQSMTDRALETIAAIEYAKSELGFEKSLIGLMGFSQAGWVMPKVSSLSDFPDFMINVSPAINWKKQSNYLTKKRLELEGANEITIDAEMNWNEVSFQLFEDTLAYSEYMVLQDSLCRAYERKSCSKIDEKRYRFIQKNIDSDARLDIANITCPMLVIFGADDLNIDYEVSYATYEHILSQNNHDSYQLKVFDHATHGLLKSECFNYIKPGLVFVAKFRLFGKSAFAATFLENVNGFIVKSTTATFE